MVGSNKSTSTVNNKITLPSLGSSKVFNNALAAAVVILLASAITIVLACPNNAVFSRK